MDKIKKFFRNAHTFIKDTTSIDFNAVYSICTNKNLTPIVRRFGYGLEEDDDDDDDDMNCPPL